MMDKIVEKQAAQVGQAKEYFLHAEGFKFFVEKWERSPKPRLGFRV